LRAVRRLITGLPQRPRPQRSSNPRNSKVPLALQWFGLNRIRFLFIRCNLQSELLQPICRHVVKSLGIGLQLEGADKVVRVPTQMRRPLAVLLDGLLKPYVQGIMKIDSGGTRRQRVSLQPVLLALSTRRARQKCSMRQASPRLREAVRRLLRTDGAHRGRCQRRAVGGAQCAPLPEAARQPQECL
jgi:hypothetical protein